MHYKNNKKAFLISQLLCGCLGVAKLMLGFCDMLQFYNFLIAATGSSFMYSWGVVWTF